VAERLKPTRSRERRDALLETGRADLLDASARAAHQMVMV